MVSFKLFAGTNIGLRENNEDNFTVCPDLTSNNWIVPADNQQAIQLGKLGCVMVVADGMGGQNAGEVASAIAIETVQEMLASENIPTGVENKASSIKDYLKKIIFEADVRVKEYSLKNPEAEGMGSTIVIAWAISRKLYVAWLGDSRAYSFVPEKGIGRMSKDHSYVQQLVDAGKLTDTEAMNHPNSNIITRSLGDNAQKAKADVAEYDLVKGEVILLCSDGLCGVCKDEEIGGIIEDSKDNLQLCKEQLTEAALNHGGSDNITITLFQVCDIDESQETGSSEKEQQSKRRFTPLNIFVCLLLSFLLGMLLFAGSKIFKKNTPAQPEYSIKLQLEKDTLEYGKTIGFKVEGIYRHYILKYDPKIIKVNTKTSQISLKANKNVAGKGEKAMFKVTCKEDTSKYDIKYIYLKKRKPSLIDRLGGGEADIKGNSNTNDKNNSDENHAGDNEGNVPGGSLTPSKGAAASTVKKIINNIAMKKVLYFIAIAIALGFTACSEDKCDHQTEISPETTISAVGNWYNEAANEECRYSADGTFYTKYNNVLRSEEIEGRWEYDKANSKLSWRYVFMGQNQFDDWKVKNLTDFSLTISSSEKGEFTYEKIVETYKLEVGNTANIKFTVEYPDYVVSSYVSTNPRLATVNSDGVIKAEGEKGTAYIKVQTNQGNVWVKVIVGDDCQDLWFDYVGVISQDYSTMISTLSSLGKPYTGEDGYSFGFKHTHHDVVDITKVYLCPEDGLVEEIQLVLKESVPEAEVLAYMNSHYYSMMEDESLVYYSTLKDKDASKAIVVYDKEKKAVYFLETKHFFQTAHLWKDFTKLFGKNKTEVKNAMTSYGYSFLTTDVSYSDNGSDYYGIVDNDYAQMIGFVFNPDNQVSEFWVYLKSSAVIKTVYNDLCNKYQEASDENSSTRRVFYNHDKSLRITLDAQSQAVVYNNQKMKQHEVSIFGLYYQGLGLTHDQIVNKFGTPMSDEDGTMYYGVYTDYVNLAAFRIDSSTKKCSIVLTTINDAISKDVVVKTFNEKYVAFEKGTSADGSQYAWINGATVAESTLGIVYKPNDRMIIYQPLNGTANAKMNSMSRAMNNQEMKRIAHVK